MSPATQIHLPPLLLWGLQAGARAQLQAAPNPPSTLASSAFPFLMLGTVSPLSFASAEASCDCKGYDDVKNVGYI